jgi:hypothetical protein
MQFWRAQLGPRRIDRVIVPRDLRVITISDLMFPISKRAINSANETDGKTACRGADDCDISGHKATSLQVNFIEVFRNRKNLATPK